MSPILGKFHVLHLSLPGQEAEAEDLPPSSQYPSMEQLSEALEVVCHHFGITSFVGLGVGLGANLLARLAARRPKLVEGLVLINCNSQTSGWVEWAYHKVRGQ